jgi:hypothetical protein
LSSLALASILLDDDCVNLMQLAKLSTLQDMYEDALELLDNAQRIAAKHEYRNELRSILCLMGIAHASADFSQYSSDLVAKSLSEAEP